MEPVQTEHVVSTDFEPVILTAPAQGNELVSQHPLNGDGQPPPIPSDQPTLERRVFSLAWPVIGENFLQTMLGIVDTMLVAWLGAQALAGVGAAIQIMFFVISALSATSIGASVLVAQSVGARALPEARRFAKQSLVWSVILSIPLSLVGLFAADLLIGIFGMEPEVTAIGVEYLKVTMGTVVVLNLLLIGGGVMRGAGDSRTPFLVTAFANVLNVVLAYGLIFGKFGMPELGAVGSAWGTLISRIAGLALLLLAMWRGTNGVSIRGKYDWWPEMLSMRQVLRIGLPAALEQVLISVGFLVMTIMVARLGTLTFAAQRISMNAMSLSFLPGFGFAMAATALVGQSVGAMRQDEGRDVARIATKWAVIWMSTLGVIFLFFGEQIVRLFTDDPIVIAIGAAGLRPVAFAQPFWAISFVQAGALRGTGNTRYPMWVNTAGIWSAVLLGGIFVYFGSQFIPMGINDLALVWTAFVVTAPVTALLMWRTFRRTITGSALTAVYET